LRTLHLHQVQPERHQHRLMLPRPSIELAAIRHGRECHPHMTFGIAIEGAFAGKLHPLSKQRQSYHFTARQRGCWAWMPRFTQVERLAKIIDHHVQYRDIGIHI
jgi:hypothetical protein